ncbi:exodeoxyribonuclease III [Dongia rigui]|uniref:Exodeoxyribonuclease III n=1 Tax=Dongia rigui TaxID=940149 RepID=A0ABU5DSA6_9PROT|nr:exodeoxyribonuclease III [Dongia rigui]MDY0870302.1 exodeoxyribonuclease III [Dongia rigui]
MKIATFNVNSLRARLANVLEWLKSESPDVALFQEIKCTTAEFPRMEFEALGYQVEAVGQKSYNGVAILSKTKFTVEHPALPGNDADEQARYLEAAVETPEGSQRPHIRVATIYLPNGNPVETEKYPYKLAWMEHLKRRAADLLKTEEPVVLGGDYNVIPTDADVYDPVAWAEDALARPQTRAKFREILHLGYTDAFQHLHPEGHRYTFWDYQAGAWQRDNGLRIDHLLLSPQAADCLEKCEIDRTPRGKEKPSDHTPIWVELRV